MYLQLTDLCRICLGDSDNFILFNAKLDFTCQTVCELVNYITNVDIDDEEQVHFLPQHVCQNCIEHLHISFNLKRVAHESNNYIKDLLKTNSTSTEINVKKETNEEIEKASDPLIKKEKNEDYFYSTSHSYNQLSVEEESETSGNLKKCTSRIQSAHRKAKTRSNKSFKEEANRSQKAIKAAERRANETLKQKRERNLREAKRIAQKRARESNIESQDERAIRLKKIARKAAERRANETPEQKSERLCREAKRIAQKRTSGQKRSKNSNNQEAKE